MIGRILNQQNYLSSTDFVMIAVIMLSHRYKMNPDNLATPLAASIGDVVSISILSAFASEFYVRMENEMWVLYIVLGVFLVLMPIWIIIVLKNKYTRNVLKSGWVPILSALLISGLVIKMATWLFTWAFQFSDFIRVNKLFVRKYSKSISFLHDYIIN